MLFRSTDRNMGFSIMLKDTSTCNWEELSFELAIFQLLDDLLYLLSYSSPDKYD